MLTFLHVFVTNYKIYFVHS